MGEHDRIAQAIEDAKRDFIPSSWALGYHVYAATTAAQGAAADAEMKREWRGRLSRYATQNRPGAADDLAALPVDRTTGAWDVLLELVYLPDPRVRLVRTVPAADLLAVLNNASLSNEQRRQQLRNRIQTYLDAAVQRVGQVP